jgi:16S rRNA (adenine(1408)-N(1))-methyltransferase
MADSAQRAIRQKLENVLFVQAAVEKLPPELTGVADRITINYPWGSLLRAVVTPEVEILSTIAGLGKAGAAITMLVNMSVFDDATYCARLGLPSPPVLADPAETRWKFRQAGFEVTNLIPDVADVPYKTTWGQKLTKGTRRRVLQLDAIVSRAAS